MAGRNPDPARTALLIYDGDALAGDTAARDVLDQLDAVEDVLRRDGWLTQRLPVGLDLGAFKRAVLAATPALAFNLVESLDGSDRLQTLAPMLLEDWRVPFTGSGTAAMLLSNHKIASKRALAARGLPFPACAWLDRDALRFLSDGEGGEQVEGSWIIKALESHASLHMDDASVLADADAETLAARLRQAEARHGMAFFAERFVDGREFNLSVLEGQDGNPRALPAAEISFAGLPAGKPRIVGYAAKWEDGSPEYLATPRVFPEGAEDADLMAVLAETALSAWGVFRLSGYARIDFRVDADGKPWILEANANPCLSPGAGLAAAAERGGISYDRLILGIAEAAFARRQGVLLRYKK